MIAQNGKNGSYLELNSSRNFHTLIRRGWLWWDSFISCSWLISISLDQAYFIKLRDLRTNEIIWKWNHLFVCFTIKFLIFLMFFHRVNLFLYFQDKMLEDRSAFFFFFCNILCTQIRFSVPHSLSVLLWPLARVIFWSASQIMKTPCLQSLRDSPLHLDSIQSSEHHFEGPVDLSSLRWPYILVYTCCTNRSISITGSTSFHSLKLTLGQKFM